MAGDGFNKLPTVSLTCPTFRLLIVLKTLEKVTLLPTTEQVNVLTATESTSMERQVAFADSGNEPGKMRTTVALAATWILLFIRVWCRNRF
jgi:hypothetical protein